MIISGIPRTLDDLASPGFVRSAPPEWAAGVATPFSARRVTLGPGEVTAAHNHHDTEVWTVLDGIGEVRSDDRVVPLSAGDSVRLPPLGVHTLRNLADDRPLTFLTQWWEDMDALADAHTRRVAAPPPADRPLVLLPSFPTPNGELHLGHLAGPYLNADACARWAAARGERAHVLLGTVGHQSQVAAAAQARGLEFHELAERNTDGIIEGLAAAGIGWDVFVRPRETAYPAMAADVFATLERRGALVRRTEPTAFCAPCDRFLFEAFVAGRCPHCGSSQTAGIECEACALPFRDSELVGHACARCGTPAGMRELTRWFFPLEAARDRLAGHLARASMSSRLRCYVDRVLAAPLPDLPVSVVAEDGIPLRVEQERPGSPYAQQRMYSAFELAARYLTALDALARTKGCSGWAEYARAHRPRTALFFGFDNAYLRAFVFPAVLGAYTADVPLPEHLVCNEFYTLDGAKFSTGRGHAIWSREVFGAGNRDQLRLYLAATSPDVRRRDFTATGYAAFVQDVLREWEHWIAGVGARVGEHFAGTAPEAGPWNADAERGYGHIRDLLAAAGSAYRPDRLGLRHAVAAMRTFVDRMSEFAEVVEDVLAGGPGSPIARTVVALELMAVRTLAAAAAPLAPDLAARLASAVGEPGGVPATDVPGWVRPGTPVSFGSGFFTEDALRSVRLPSES